MSAQSLIRKVGQGSSRHDFVELSRYFTESNQLSRITRRKIRISVVYGRETITNFNNFVLEICNKPISEGFIHKLLKDL